MHDDADGLTALRRLGARSVPVVAKGDRFVFAQSLGDVADLLDIKGVGGPSLSPAELVEKLDLVLAAAERLVQQIPPKHLEDKLPNRDRSYRVLAHHIFRIPEAFLDLTDGVALTHESLIVAPGPEHENTEGIAAYGRAVRSRLQAWWSASADHDGRRLVPTYWGEQPLHDVLERTTWHSAQHVRQIMMVLEGLGIEPEQALTAEDLAGLPLPEKVWDD